MDDAVAPGFDALEVIRISSCLVFPREALTFFGILFFELIEDSN